MGHSIQSVRRSILPKIRTLLQTHLIQHKSQNPISYFPKFLSFQSSIQPQVRNLSSCVSETRKHAIENHLLRILDDEVQYELIAFPLPQPLAKFNGFEVAECPGEQWISLRKKFGKNEEIKVEVTMFDGSVPIRKEGDKPGVPWEEIQLHITMIISIFKQDSNQVLEFVCSAWPDALEVKKLFVRGQSEMSLNQPYTGPLFRELDDELQNSLYEFLEERGIDDDLCGFLHKYIHYKDKSEYVRWIQSVRSTVEKK